MLHIMVMYASVGSVVAVGGRGVSVAGGVTCVEMTGIVMVLTEVSAWVDTQALRSRVNRNNGRYGFIITSSLPQIRLYCNPV